MAAASLPIPLLLALLPTLPAAEDNPVIVVVGAPPSAAWGAPRVSGGATMGPALVLPGGSGRPHGEFQQLVLGGCGQL